MLMRSSCGSPVLWEVWTTEGSAEKSQPGLEPAPFSSGLVQDSQTSRVLQLDEQLGPDVNPGFIIITRANQAVGRSHMTGLPGWCFWHV